MTDARGHLIGYYVTSPWGYRDGYLPFVRCDVAPGEEIEALKRQTEEAEESLLRHGHQLHG